MDESFEQRMHCKNPECNRTGTKREMLMNGGLCWKCRREKEESEQEESFVKAGETNLETHFDEHKQRKGVKG